MTNERPSNAVPVLLGTALSLLVLFLVVGRADAATDCDLCLRDADNYAKTWCAANINSWSTYFQTPAQRMENCIYTKKTGYAQANCYSTNRCPGGSAFTGEQDCGSEGCRQEGSAPVGSCGKDASPNAGAICSNTCWGRPCTTNTGGGCKDLSANPGKSLVSLCSSQCGCDK